MRDKTIDQPNERPRVLDVDGSWPVRVLIPIRGGMAAEISFVVPRGVSIPLPAGHCSCRERS